MVDPAMPAFLASFEQEKVWAQILIQRGPGGFSVRHVSDRSQPVEMLRVVPLEAVRKLVQFNSLGQFRPLRSAPDLPQGWILHCQDEAGLGRALAEIYPGSVADWFHFRQASPRATGYRDFTNRQTGMYRVSQQLTDAQAGQVISAGCASRFCLKRRVWTVDGLPADPAGSKSEIPCLEPCALLLELARKSARIEQEERIAVNLTKSEFESWLEAMEKVIAGGLSEGRVGDLGSCVNPRRLQLILEKYRDAWPKNEAPAPG